MYRVVLELALADVGLVDEELDVSLLLLLVNALESIRSDNTVLRSQCAAIELRCSYNAVGYLNSRNVVYLLALTSVECKVHVALLHLRNIVERCLHCVAATYLV